MTSEKFLRTRFEWLDQLAAGSSAIASLKLKDSLADEIYKVAGEKQSQNVEAFNFANSAPHNTNIIRTVEALKDHAGSEDLVRKYITDLTARNTYGTFCELAAYNFLIEGGLDFEAQAKLSGKDILNPNGSDLDGLLKLPEEVYFDIKAFGFHEHLINILTERLSADLSPNLVQAEDSWDVPIASLFDLLSKDYATLKADLEQRNFAQRGRLRFVKKIRSQIITSARSVDPERLAIENKDYAFKYAKQFTRNKPFILMFVIHPWLSGLSLHNNFNGAVDNFTRKFAELTFVSFLNDSSIVFDVTKAAASQLISGLLFIDAWAEQPQSQNPKHRLFINSHAANPLGRGASSSLTQPYGAALRTLTI